MKQDIAQKLYNFLRIPSVVGFETPFINHLASEADRLDLESEILTDRTGRRTLLSISSDPSRTKPILTAHIDRHGLYKLNDEELIYRGKGPGAQNEMVEDIEYAASFIKRTEFDKDRFTFDRMIKVCNYFVGEEVALYHPNYYKIFKNAVIEDPGFCVINENLTFKIKEFYSVNVPEYRIIPIAFVPDENLTDGEKIWGQIDNALTVVVIFKLFEMGYKFTALFAVDEEIGYSWEHILRWYRKTELYKNELLVLDTSPYSNPEMIEDLQAKGALVLRNKDNNASFDPETTAKMKEMATKLQIAFDVKDETLAKEGSSSFGSTELGKLIANSGGEVTGTTLQIPTSEYHTNRESASIKSVENMIELLCQYLS